MSQSHLSSQSRTNRQSSLSLPWSWKRTENKTIREKELHRKKKDELVHEIIAYESSTKELESQLTETEKSFEELKRSSKHRHKELLSKIRVLEDSKRKETEERDRRIENLESRLSCFKKDVSHVIEEGCNIKILGGKFKIKTQGNVMIGKTNVVCNEMETTEILEKFLSEIRTRCTEALRKWALANKKLRTMKVSLIMYLHTKCDLLRIKQNWTSL